MKWLLVWRLTLHKRRLIILNKNCRAEFSMWATVCYDQLCCSGSLRPYEADEPGRGPGSHAERKAPGAQGVPAGERRCQRGHGWLQNVPHCDRHAQQQVRFSFLRGRNFTKLLQETICTFLTIVALTEFKKKKKTFGKVLLLYQETWKKKSSRVFLGKRGAPRISWCGFKKSSHIYPKCYILTTLKANISNDKIRFPATIPLAAVVVGGQTMETDLRPIFFKPNASTHR